MKLFEQNIRRVEPYVAGEQPQHKVIKLNTNENPYPPAPGVKKVLNEMDGDRLRLYPDMDATVLVDALADVYQVDRGQIFVGVGSDDILALAFLTFFNSDKPILFPDITYSFYKVWAELYRIPYECPAVDDNFEIRREDYYRPNGGVIFPNPNAPTSIYENLDFVEDVLKHNRDVIVIVDEAYIDYGGRSALELIDKYENLLVVQTFSKSRSMAGMRIGYAIGSPLLISRLSDVKFSFNSYTMNLPSLLAGAEAVRDTDYFQATIQKIMETREWSKEQLRQYGFEFPESGANFIFARHPKYTGGELQQIFKQRDIYVRHWQKERIDPYLRITIGTREEMEAVWRVCREL